MPAALQSVAAPRGPAELFDEVGPQDYDLVVDRLAAVKEEILLLLVNSGIPVDEYTCAPYHRQLNQLRQARCTNTPYIQMLLLIAFTLWPLRVTTPW